MDFYQKWKDFLLEAERDAKILRKINIDKIKKDIGPPEPDEDYREYNERISANEKDPRFVNPIFPTGLVEYIESLDDRFFPTANRKAFAKWLANAIIGDLEGDPLSSPRGREGFEVYGNDIRYIVDYLNGARRDDIPGNVWNLDFLEVLLLAGDWHETLKGVVHKGDYETKDVVYKFKDGFTIVKVPHGDLEAEGNKMGHCVGTYCDRVYSGKLAVYSLRDSDNEPHATISVYQKRKADEIKGKGNDPPVRKYALKIREWLKAKDIDASSSEDYPALFEEKEMEAMLQSGDLNLVLAKRLAEYSENPKVIKYFVDRIGDLDEEIFISVAENPHLGIDQALSIFKENLTRHALGNRMAWLFGSRPGVRPYDPQDLVKLAWPVLQARFKSKGELDEEIIFAFNNLISFCENLDLASQMVTILIEKSNLDKALALPSSANVHFNAPSMITVAIKSYLSGFPNADREILKKLYQLTKTEKYEAGFKFRDNALASVIGNKSITDGMAKDMVENLDSLKYYHVKTFLSNPSLKDTYKIAMISKMSKSKFSDRETALLRSRTGISASRAAAQNKYTGIINIVGEHMFNYIYSPSESGQDRPGGYSKKVLKFSLDVGFMEKSLNKQANNRFYSKYRHWPRLSAPKNPADPSMARPQPEDVKKFDKILDQARIDLRQKIESIEKRKKEADDTPPWSDTFDSDRQLNEEVNKYFRKQTMNKKAFFEEVKQSFIKEEKGRSRQRGIYKFHCMVSYSLTMESEKSRGLDDILADLRALPNVTIVTVAIRNKKIAERRYIAGLAIKFIPSIPGEFNAPEDVKARVIKDIKRLPNVESMFKVSTGLNRLE